MISIASKPPTHRTATATGTIIFSHPGTDHSLQSATLKKGDALAVSRIAGISAAKKTADLIPLAHPGLGITGVSVDVEVVPPKDEGGEKKGGEGEDKGEKYGGVKITATVECFASTGVEMEALTAVTVAGLAMVDMCKGVDRGMVLGNVRVVEKRGGHSGSYSVSEGGVVVEEGERQEGMVREGKEIERGMWEGGVKVEGTGKIGWRRERDLAGRGKQEKEGQGHAGEYDWDWD
jgi:molybdenum cofactor biosynthesis enzyme